MNKKVEKQKALAALKKVINTKTDVDDAFFCSLGSVCLKYGTPGTPPKFKKAYGIAHIIAKRDYEHASDPKSFPETGKQVVSKLMDVIVYGKSSTQNHQSNAFTCKRTASRPLYRKTGMETM